MESEPIDEYNEKGRRIVYLENRIIALILTWSGFGFAFTSSCSDSCAGSQRDNAILKLRFSIVKDGKWIRFIRSNELTNFFNFSFFFFEFDQSTIYSLVKAC